MFLGPVFHETTETLVVLIVLTLLLSSPALEAELLIPVLTYQLG